MAGSSYLPTEGMKNLWHQLRYRLAPDITVFIQINIRSPPDNRRSQKQPHATLELNQLQQKMPH